MTTMPHRQGMKKYFFTISVVRHGLEVEGDGFQKTDRRKAVSGQPGFDTFQ
jgi:hypothetical protein